MSTRKLRARNMQSDRLVICLEQSELIEMLMQHNKHLISLLAQYMDIEEEERLLSELRDKEESING